MARKIRVAFVKFGGLSAGGTEKFLQTIAAHLDRERFEVDYYYCDAAPYVGSSYVHATTDPHREEYMKRHGVNLIRFSVGSRDARVLSRPWKDTDFWEVFDETRYDIIQTGRPGYPEYPFTRIRTTPIVDSIHIMAGVDNQFNIARVMHITDWSARRWVRMGGDRHRVVRVSHPMEMPPGPFSSLRAELGIEGRFVFGFHQRNSDEIFSPLPLASYAAIESDKTAFVLLGGGARYREQARSLGLRTVHFLDHSGDASRIHAFLNALDVYAHGRKDGEINSTAMAEAMYFGLPIVSHTSKIHNGHIECIGDAGIVVSTEEEYAAELRRLMEDEPYREERSRNSRQRFAESYELTQQIAHIESIYEDVVRDPFPRPFSRLVSSLRMRYIFVHSWTRIRGKIIRMLESHDTKHP